MYLMWICEYCYNKDWLYGEVFIKIIFVVLLYWVTEVVRVLIVFLDRGGIEKCMFRFMYNVDYCLVGGSYMRNIFKISC